MYHVVGGDLISRECSPFLYHFWCGFFSLFQAALAFWPCSASCFSIGERYPNALWGLSVLYSICHDVIFARASSIDKNQCSFKHSCRKRELNASTSVLSHGLPGRHREILSRRELMCLELIDDVQAHFNKRSLRVWVKLTDPRPGGRNECACSR